MFFFKNLLKIFNSLINDFLKKVKTPWRGFEPLVLSHTRFPGGALSQTQSPWHINLKWKICRIFLKSDFKRV